MNNVKKGYLRDKEIMSLIEEHGALTTEQIACLVYPDLKAGYRKAQQKLKKLHDRKRLKRVRLAIDLPYTYYIEKHGRMEHLVSLNWVHIWFTQRLATWEKLYWATEQNYGILQADAFAGVKNTITGGYKFWFVEIDRGFSKWDKVQKYNQLYESDNYSDHWWVKHTDRFPCVLCVTERKLTIQGNTHGLEFDVRMLDDIIKEVMPWKMQP